jgi:Phage protein Gp138 N-terminal domain
MRKQVSLSEVLDATQSNLRDGLYHAMPGIVQAYYPSEQSADVQPAVHDVRIDTTTGARWPEVWPVLPKVRVLFPKFGGLGVWCDLAAGDKVLLISLDLDPTAHRLSGHAEDPIDTRRHGGAYWVAFPGDITDAGTLPSTGGAIMVGKPGGVMVKVSASEVDLGAASPSDKVALASVLDSFINVFLSTWVPVSMDGGAALKAALGLWASTMVPAYTTTGSTTVKVAP